MNTARFGENSTEMFAETKAQLAKDLGRVAAGAAAVATSGAGGGILLAAAAGAGGHLLGRAASEGPAYERRYVGSDLLNGAAEGAIVGTASYLAGEISAGVEGAQRAEAGFFRASASTVLKAAKK